MNVVVVALFCLWVFHITTQKTKPEDEVGTAWEMDALHEGSSPCQECSQVPLGSPGAETREHRHTHTTEKGVDLTGRNNVVTVLPGGISVSQA